MDMQYTSDALYELDRRRRNRRRRQGQDITGGAWWNNWGDFKSALSRFGDEGYAADRDAARAERDAAVAERGDASGMLNAVRRENETLRAQVIQLTNENIELKRLNEEGRVGFDKVQKYYQRQLKTAYPGMTFVDTLVSDLPTPTATPAPSRSVSNIRGSTMNSGPPRGSGRMPGCAWM
jgi:hypothetical protein